MVRAECLYNGISRNKVGGVGWDQVGKILKADEILQAVGSKGLSLMIGV